MKHRAKLHYFTGFKHCGSQKVFMIEGQGTNSPAFTTYRSADTYRKNHGIQPHRVFSARYTTIVAMRLDSIY